MLRSPATPRSTRCGLNAAHLLAWVIGVSGAVVRVGWDRPGTMAVGLLLGAMALLVLLGLDLGAGSYGWWIHFVPLVLAAVLGIGIAGRGYVIPVAVVLLGTVTAYGATVRWSLVRTWPQRRSGLVGPAVGLCVVASFSWYRHGSYPRFAALSFLAMGVLELYARADRVGVKIDRLLHGLAHAVATAISTMLAATAVIVVVIPVNLVSRVFRYSSLDGGWVTASSAWIAVDPSRLRTHDGAIRDADRMALRETRPSPAVRRRGHMRLVVPVIAVVVVAFAAGGDASWPWGTGGSEANQRGTFARSFEDDPAFEDAPWARNLRLGLLDAWSNLEFNAAAGGWQIRDVESDYINVTDGERRTRAADPKLGRPIEVWFLGGSAAFGAGQRDDHTIPSELVRLADATSIPLHIRNMAVPATVNWQSAMLLTARLQWEPAPDLVVVYDGANDLALQDVLVERGQGSSDRPASLIDGDLDSMLRERAEDAGTTPGDVPAVVTSEPDERPTPAQRGASVRSRYSKGVEVIRQICDRFGVPTAMFWQPELRTKEPLTAADKRTLKSVGADGDLSDWRTYSAAARAQLAGAGVTDLTATFDGEDRPLYWDTVHTNELGARMAAEAIFAQIEPTLRILRGSVGG